MAEIEIVYEEGYCSYGMFAVERNYSEQCHTCVAEDAGCKYFDSGNHDPNVIPFGDCVHAVMQTKYKGMTVKKYDLAEVNDCYNPHLSYMILKTAGREYNCTKVILNGTCIYDRDSEEDDEQ